MRRLVAVAAGLTLALAAVACGDGEDTTSPEILEGPITTRPAPTTTVSEEADSTEATDVGPPWLLATEPLANAAGSPRMLVTARGTPAVRIDRGVPTEIEGVPDDAVPLLGDGSGLLLTETREVDRDDVAVGVGLLRIEDGEATEVPLAPHDTVALHDLVVLDGRPHALYSLFADPASTGGEATGRLVLHDLVDDATRELAVAAAPELLLARASAGRDVVVLSYYSDLTETVSFVDHQGAEVERPSPTDELAYNAPPLVTGAVISPDGSELAYLEGPDVDGTTDPERLVGQWDVVIDDADGEQLRLTVADQSVSGVSIDFDGRWLVVSGMTTDGPVQPLLIDTEATDLATYLIPDVVGVATLESAARA